MPEPRPLYRIPMLKGQARVYVVEGEKTADAACELGLTATTSAGDSKAAGKTDWTPLAGCDVVILPDNDDAGRRYADEVVAQLSTLAPATVVKVVRLPGLLKGGDIVDYVEARSGEGLDATAIRAEIEGRGDEAAPIELTQPAPLIEPYVPFPVDALPEPVRSFVINTAKAIGCDTSFVAVPMFVALAGTIGTTRRILLKRRWTEPAILWAAIVGESGTCKTPAFKAVMRFVRDRQARALHQHAEAMEAYRVEFARYEKELARWKRSKGSGEDPPQEPEIPVAERHLVNDVTIEALMPVLQQNPRGVLVARDEIGGWLAAFDRYVGKRGGGDASHWLSMHNAEDVIVDRKTGQPRTIHIRRASVSIVGGIQPGTLRRSLGSEHRENGLLARLLLAMPPRRAKRWTEAEVSERDERAIATLFDRLYALKPDHDDEANPVSRSVGLTRDAKRAWISFYGEHANEQVELSGELCAAWSKLEAYAARLALIVHLVRAASGDPSVNDPDEVDEHSIAAGVALARWFGREARRVYAVLGESEADRTQRRLVERIEAKGGSVSVREWQRSQSHASACDAEAELEELVKAGFGRWHVPPQEGPGRPSKRFVLNGFDKISSV